MYSGYYQAFVISKFCWVVTATLRSFENIAFDRALVNKMVDDFGNKVSLFEFFVPEGQEKVFLEVMKAFKDDDIITSFTKLPNRLEDPTQEF